MKFPFYTIIVLCLFCFSAFAQSISSSSTFQAVDNSIWMDGHVLQTGENSVIERLMGIKNMSARSAFHIISETEDDLDMQHTKYQQYYDNLEVKGAQIIAHYKDNKLELVNGNLAEKISISTQPIISSDEALSIALKEHGGVVYMWEDIRREDILKTSKNDPFATYYPNTKLVVVDQFFPRNSGHYVLAYEMSIYSSHPLKKAMYYVDAMNGTVITAIDGLQGGAVEGKAVTRYLGEQAIVADSMGVGQYRLFDETRGAGIWTLNENTGLDFLDDDNFWDNANAEQDEVAGDIHLGAEATYDYFFEKFGWDSYDNNGSMIVSYAHEGENYNNAFWDGSSMHYGDGDSIRFGPFTTIDVCGHELAHGVTEYSAGLIYAYESGALNESFSDIFGKAIEHEVDPTGFTWFLGKAFSLEDKPFRDMKDPNSTMDPKYYKGKDYWFLTGDNGGVHSNSGVQNHWFYLLVEGESGTNEKGYDFNVPSIGWEKAAAIAFRSLTTYLTPNSDFKAAYRGSVRSAGDLYGPCSDEYKAVIEAWATVGVSEKITPGDIALVGLGDQLSGCGITGVNVDLAIQNVSCEHIVEPGESLNLFYQLNSDPINQQMVTFDNGLDGGEFQNITLNTALSITTFGPQVLKVWFEYNNPVLRNDTLTYHFVNKGPDYGDIIVNNYFISAGDRCEPGNSIRTFLFVEYDGCEEVPGPIQIKAKYEVNGDTGTVTYTFRDTLRPGVEGFMFGTIPVALDHYGLLTLVLQYPGDPNDENSMLQEVVGPVEAITSPYTENMDDDVIDSSHTFMVQGELTQTTGQEISGDNALWISGDRLLEDDEVLAVSSDDLETMIRANDRFVTTISYCSYVSAFISPLLRLDMAQSYSDMDYASYGINPDHSTLAGVELVFASGVEMIDVINDQSATPKLKRHDYDLTPYKDSLLMVNLYFFAITKDIGPNGELTLDGDNNIVAQIAFLDQPLSTNDFLEGDVNIYPNPSSSSFSVQFKDWSESEYEVRLFDLHGRLIEISSISVNENTVGEVLESGIYSLQVLAKGEILYRQMILKM